jgi:NAD(P)-dependent dehydrogenase (short-subunit alcohol dehydrogenase family)
MSTTNQRVAFITGGNRGLGLQTAIELANLPISVILGSRNLAKGEAAAEKLRDDGKEVEVIAFDITDPKSHQHAFHYFFSRYGKLDILVNNAGIWRESADASGYAPDTNRTSSVPLDILRETFETNFFATVALTQALVPLIRRAPAGRIVNVSSILGSLTLHSDQHSAIYAYKVFGYDASKTALNAFTVQLAHELRDTKIKVNSAHPGWVKTDMGGAGADLDITEGGKTSALLATLADDGPTGGFFHLGQSVPW